MARKQKNTFTIEQKFTDICNQNDWGSEESVSGFGSTIESTQKIQKVLPPLLKKLHVTKMFDASCGDFNWLSKVDLGKVKELWFNHINENFSELKLDLPTDTWFQSGGRSGKQSESLGSILTDMHYIQRSFPNAEW